MTTKDEVRAKQGYLNPFDRTVTVMDYEGFKALPNGALLLDRDGIRVRISWRDGEYPTWIELDGTKGARSRCISNGADDEYVVKDDSDVEINGPFIVLNPDILGRFQEYVTPKPEAYCLATKDGNWFAGDSEDSLRLGGYPHFARRSVADLARLYGIDSGEPPLKVGDVTTSSKQLDDLPTDTVIRMAGTDIHRNKLGNGEWQYRSIGANPSDALRDEWEIMYIPEAS